MHPVYVERLAAERVRDLRAEAIAAERARLVRSARRARRAHPDTTAGPGTPLRTRGAVGRALLRGTAARHAG